MADDSPSIYELLADGGGNFTFYNQDGNEITFQEHISISPEDRRVGVDQVGSLYISTVFLGYGWKDMPDMPPLIWETMVFRGEDILQCSRVATREEALEVHAAAVDEARRGWSTS